MNHLRNPFLAATVAALWLYAPVISAIPLWVFAGGAASGSSGTSPTAANLTGWWALSSVNDSSSNTYHLSNTGSATFVTGKVGNALYAESGKYLAIGDAAWQTPSTTMSLSFWMNPDDATPAGNVGVVSKWVTTGNQRSWSVRHDTTGITNFVFSDGTSTTKVVSTTSTRSDGAWTHLVIVWVASTSVTIYVDGVVETTDTTSIPSALLDTTADFVIGRYATNSFVGLVDEVALFNDALTAGEVTWLYNSGVGKTFTDL